MSKKEYRFHHDYRESVELKDGRKLTLRLVRPNDKELVG
jgi:hypothetical protein